MEEGKESWTETSRYQTLREYTFLPPDRLEVICRDVLYCSFGGHPDRITSIDPDGGPYLCKDRIVKSYKITTIISHQQPFRGDKETMKIVLGVEKIE
jgi:hypothetical protein